jgi:hypothetical protein
LKPDIRLASIANGCWTLPPQKLSNLEAGTTTLADDSGYSPSPEALRAIAQIESGGDPNAVTGSYKGLYQLSEPEFQRYGGQGSIFDPAENSRIAALKIADEGNQLAKALGRPVTDAEVYLAHQQGVGGATAHLSNPDQPAWKSMAGTGEGRQKGDDWARRAIWGNIPDQYKAQFGSVDNVTSGQFADMWRQRYGRASGQPMTQTASAAPTSPSSAPSQPAPQQPQAAPNFAPQAAPQAAPSAFAQMPAMAQAPPIFFAPRRQIDLTQLRTALARAPIFPRG